MSDRLRPESATASLTAVSAWAASGMSAERETLEKPTPLTATLHRFSHIGSLSNYCRAGVTRHLAPLFGGFRFATPALRLDRRHASFETRSSSAPQDDGVL